MLDTIGLSRIEDLVAHLPAAVRYHKPLAIAPGRSEYDILDYFKARGSENATAGGNGYACFLGAGVYNHYRPVMVDTVVSRGEFLTSYTPYQAEISQGTLTAIFEFQSMICQLTGMDVANASMYDASTAVPEAAMMAIRATGRSHILTARSVHPEYREVLHTYTQHQGIPLDEFGYDAESGLLDIEDLSRTITKDTAAVIIQTPNFFGIVENVKQAAAIAHEHGALLVVVFSEAVSLGLLEPPRDADIVAGELQSFAIPAQLRRTLRRRDRLQGKIDSPDPGTPGRRDQGRQRQPRVLSDAGHARAAHPPREGHLQHLHQSGADRPDGDGVSRGLRQEGLRELAVQNLSKAHYLAGKLKPRFTGRSSMSLSRRRMPRPSPKSTARSKRRRSSAACRSKSFIPNSRTPCCCAAPK